MKKEVYKELSATVPNFDKMYTAVVPIGEIKYDKESSQPRAKGHVLAHVPRYRAILQEGGPKAMPPASVRRLPNGKYELKDGSTRALAADTDTIGELWISWYHDAVMKPTPSKWRDLQMDWNDHVRSAPSSDDDIRAYLSYESDNGHMQHKVGFPYKADPEKFIEDAITAYRNALPNGGRSKKWWRSAISKALKGNITISYEVYTKTQLFNMYCQLHNFGGTSVGEVSNGEVVFPFRQPNEKNPHVIGSIAGKRMDNPGVKYTLIYCVGNLAGKDDEAIRKERKDIEKWVKKVNKVYPGWIDALYFAPQIKTGANKENMYTFISGNI